MRHRGGKTIIGCKARKNRNQAQACAGATFEAGASLGVSGGVRGLGLDPNPSHARLQGQAMLESMLLLSVILGLYLIFVRGWNEIHFDQLVLARITGPFAAAYCYGHPKAKGFDDGGPQYHPRAESGEGSFRLFVNPTGGGGGGGSGG